MTPEQKFHFDLKGWVMIPAVLDNSTINACKKQLDLIHNHRDQLEEMEQIKPSLTGPLLELLDHPVLVDILNELIGPASQTLDADRSEAYSFRLESSIYALREYSVKGKVEWNPHQGTKGFGPHEYRISHGRIYSGQTRAIWELTNVLPDGGGTVFLSGSHKANFEITENYLKEESPLFESYVCPPGSLILFCERSCHSGVDWQNKKEPRMAVLNCYNHLEAQVHRLNIPREIVAKMPHKRQTLFRGVWNWWNKGLGQGKEANTYYSAENHLF